MSLRDDPCASWFNADGSPRFSFTQGRDGVFRVFHADVENDPGTGQKTSLVTTVEKRDEIIAQARNARDEQQRQKAALDVRFVNPGAVKPNSVCRGGRDQRVVEKVSVGGRAMLFRGVSVVEFGRTGCFGRAARQCMSSSRGERNWHCSRSRIFRDVR